MEQEPRKVGRPRTLHEPVRIIIAFNRSEYERLDQIAKARGITRSQLFRDALARVKK